MTTISEVFWNATCDCGWRTTAPNDADTLTNKINTHLKLVHEKRTAAIAITSYLEARPRGILPALGKLVTAPADVVVTPHPA